MKNFVILILTILLFSNTIFSNRVDVIKSAPSSIALGDRLLVNILIKNNDMTEKNLVVTENIGNADAIDPALIIPSNDSGRFAIRLPYFEWQMVLAGGEEKNISYTIKPLELGFYSLSPTVVKTNQETYYSNTLVVSVKCKQTNMCDFINGENYLTCPDNCASGGKDNYCDEIKDNRCDPDCAVDKDFDCHCGNGVCETNLGENYVTCAKDCSSGKADGICDGVIDGRCDADCLSIDDSDCQIPTSKKSMEVDFASYFIIFICAIVLVVFVATVIFLKFIKKQ